MPRQLLVESAKLCYQLPKQQKGVFMAKNSELGPTRSVGVGLKQVEIDELDELASKLGFSRNAIMVWMIRHFLRKVREGEIEIPVVTKTEVKRYLGDP
jgi:hypothetical protein